MRSYLLLTLLLSLGLLWSCKPDDSVLESDVQALQFSADTLTFDTVFTTIGSVTRWITIYNPTSRDMVLDEIRLVDQANGVFQLNIDGIPGNQASNVLIPSKDSRSSLMMWLLNHPSDLTPSLELPRVSMTP